MDRVISLDDFAARLRKRMLATSEVRDTAALRKPRESVVESGWDHEFNRLALELFMLQFEHNKAYRRLCMSRGIGPPDVSDWKEIPAIATCAFKEVELSCIPSSKRTVVFFSSGTTQQRPSRHFHHEQSLEVYEASLTSWFSLAVCGAMPSDAIGGLALTPPGAQAQSSSLVHMFETLRRHLNLKPFTFTGRIADNAGWVLDCGASVGALRQAIESNEPILVLGTAFSFVQLLDYLADQRLSFSLPCGSRVLETGGYKGRSRALPKSELHSLIASRLGVPPSRVICEYGMSELGSQAYEIRPAKELRNNAMPPAEAGGFRLPPWAKAQIISPETGCEVAAGETGLIRIFDLANVYSVLAIQTEDLATRKNAGFELLGRARLAEPRGCSLMAAST